MTPPEQASQIVQKHYEIIDSHLLFHGMTEMEMKIMAEKHAAQEVRGIIEELKYFNHKLTPVLSERIRIYKSILTELKRMSEK